MHKRTMQLRRPFKQIKYTASDLQQLHSGRVTPAPPRQSDEEREASLQVHTNVLSKRLHSARGGRQSATGRPFLGPATPRPQTARERQVADMDKDNTSLRVRGKIYNRPQHASAATPSRLSLNHPEPSCSPEEVDRYFQELSYSTVRDSTTLRNGRALSQRHKTLQRLGRLGASKPPPGMAQDSTPAVTQLPCPSHHTVRASSSPSHATTAAQQQPGSTDTAAEAEASAFDRRPNGCMWPLQLSAAQRPAKSKNPGSLCERQTGRTFHGREPLLPPAAQRCPRRYVVSCKNC